jgi:hypothetical protein
MTVRIQLFIKIEKNTIIHALTVVTVDHAMMVRSRMFMHWQQDHRYSCSVSEVIIVQAKTARSQLLMECR